MKLSNGIKWALGLASVLVIGAFACKATMSLEAAANIAGQTGTAKISYDGRDVKADELPGDSRADVRFFDAKGKELPPGANGVGENQRVAVPPGASYCEVSGASSSTSCTGCTPPPGGGGGTMLEGGEVLAVIAVDVGAADAWTCAQSQDPDTDSTGQSPGKWVYVYTLKADLDGSSVWGNVSGSFTVQGTPSADEIHGLIEEILLRGHGAPVPAGVEVDTFVRILPEPLGARLRIADETQSFSSMLMQWNGSPYADLGVNSSSYSAANGWQVIEVFIPIADFQVNPFGGTSNSMDLEWKSFEDSFPNLMHQAVTYL
ncbi:MAG TPA: hypothetical protein VK843_00465 [Planctomycetota bacterium]|nr:hypothetical protein [Planctomycetota bacterium]